VRRVKVDARRLCRSMDPLDIASAAALSDQHAARAEDSCEVREQRIVISDPMEGSRRENRIDHLQRQGAGEIGSHEGDSSAKGCESVARFQKHCGGEVERDEGSLG